MDRCILSTGVDGYKFSILYEDFGKIMRNLSWWKLKKFINFAYDHTSAKNLGELCEVLGIFSSDYIDFVFYSAQNPITIRLLENATSLNFYDRT